jgi:hypothetical protein
MFRKMRSTFWYQNDAYLINFEPCLIYYIIKITNNQRPRLAGSNQIKTNDHDYMLQNSITSGRQLCWFSKYSVSLSLTSTSKNRERENLDANPSFPKENLHRDSSPRHRRFASSTAVFSLKSIAWKRVGSSECRSAVARRRMRRGGGIIVHIAHWGSLASLKEDKAGVLHRRTC